MIQYRPKQIAAFLLTASGLVVRSWSRKINACISSSIKLKDLKTRSLEGNCILKQSYWVETDTTSMIHGHFRHIGKRGWTKVKVSRYGYEEEDRSVCKMFWSVWTEATRKGTHYIQGHIEGTSFFLSVLAVDVPRKVRGHRFGDIFKGSVGRGPLSWSAV